MRRTADQVTREITRIMNHVGINPDETLEVRTDHYGYRFTSRIRGVDLGLAMAALTTYLVERPLVDVRRVGDSIVLTQWDRW